MPNAELPSFMLLLIVVIGLAAFALVGLWWIWKPQRPVDRVAIWKESFLRSLGPVPTNAEVEDPSLWDLPGEQTTVLADMPPDQQKQVVAASGDYWKDREKIYIPEFLPWPFPTWSVRSRPFDWLIDC